MDNIIKLLGPHTTRQSGILCGYSGFIMQQSALGSDIQTI